MPSRTHLVQLKTFIRNKIVNSDKHTKTDRRTFVRQIRFSIISSEDLFLSLFCYFVDLDKLYIEDKSAVRLDTSGTILAITEL